MDLNVHIYYQINVFNILTNYVRNRVISPTNISSRRCFPQPPKLAAICQSGGGSSNSTRVDHGGGKRWQRKGWPGIGKGNDDWQVAPEAWPISALSISESQQIYIGNLFHQDEKEHKNKQTGLVLVLLGHLLLWNLRLQLLWSRAFCVPVKKIRG